MGRCVGYAMRANDSACTLTIAHVKGIGASRICERLRLSQRQRWAKDRRRYHEHACGLHTLVSATDKDFKEWYSSESGGFRRTCPCWRIGNAPIPQVTNLSTPDTFLPSLNHDDHQSGDALATHEPQAWPWVGWRCGPESRSRRQLTKLPYKIIGPACSKEEVFWLRGCADFLYPHGYLTPGYHWRWPCF